MKRVVRLMSVIACVVAVAPALLAQWPAYPSGTVPKNAKGEPDMDAPAPRHSPLKSGLPSGVRGTGALRFTVPSAFFGALRSGWAGHCAPMLGETSITSNTMATNRALYMFVSRINSQFTNGRYRRPK